MAALPDKESLKILLLTYYWPPSAGSGVQRWMYFAKFLSRFGHHITVITVSPNEASYKFQDDSFLENVKGIETIYTATREPFSLYSKFTGRSRSESIPLGFSGESNPDWKQKTARFIRGNFFIPDARKGWIPFAVEAAGKQLREHSYDLLISTGPPHSTHLAALKLKKEFNIRWLADFRDPWTELYYNKQMYQTWFARLRDRQAEASVMAGADYILTVGPSLQHLLKSKISESKKVSYIYNGYDSERMQWLKRNRHDEEFHIRFIGILGDNSPVSAFAIALNKVVDKASASGKKVKMFFTGSVSPSIMQAFREIAKGLEIISESYLSHELALQKMKDADLLFTSLPATVDGKYFVSGKLMEYLASETPVLCLGEKGSDADKLLSGFSNAALFAFDDVTGMTLFLDNTISAGSGRITYFRKGFEQYSREQTARQLEKLLKEICSIEPK